LGSFFGLIQPQVRLPDHQMDLGRLILALEDLCQQPFSFCLSSGLQKCGCRSNVQRDVFRGEQSRKQIGSLLVPIGLQIGRPIGAALYLPRD
jgi:hypothetical protein